MWLRKSKPKTLIPIIYACAGIVATMPSITRSAAKFLFTCKSCSSSKLSLLLKVAGWKLLFKNSFFKFSYQLFYFIQLFEAKLGMALP